MIAPRAKIPWLSPSWRGENVSRRIDCAVARSPPPKAPCTIRAEMSIGRSPEAPHTIDASVKPAIDATK